MPEINWGMAQMPDFGGNALAAFEQGRQIARQRKTEEAWGAYAANPDDPNALNALAQYDPKSAIALRQDAEKRRREMMAQDLQRKAVAGDPAAMAQLSGIDLDAWSKLDTQQRTVAKQRAEYIGNSALAISRLPPQQQAAAWDAAIEQGVQLGMTELASQRGKYSPQGLQAAISSAGMMSKFIDMTEPKYQVVPQGGSMVNTNDPSAIKQFQQQQAGGGSGDLPRVNTPDEARKLPPGSKFVMPDGRIGTVPGGQTATPSGTFLGNFQGIPGERVTSGYRTPAHNKAVGGVPNSFHQRKDAQGRPLGRDSVPPPGMSMAAYHAQLVRLNPDKDVINEGDHVHMEPKG